MQNTRVGQLLPFQPSDEPCNERGGCFVAGDTRVNENTALAAMHTVWVRLHNFYAREIIKAAKNRPGTFPTLQPNNRDRNIIIFEEARKIVIAILQHIFYYEWLPIIVDVPHYKGYIIHLYDQILSKLLLLLHSDLAIRWFATVSKE